MSYQAFIGRSERRQDTVWPLLARALAATLNVAAPGGEHLPPLWHWTIFQEWAPAQAGAFSFITLSELASRSAATARSRALKRRSGRPVVYSLSPCDTQLAIAAAWRS